jgi:acyl dehydratase
MPLNREMVGQEFGPFERFAFTPEGIAQFVDATSAGDIAAYGPDGGRVPPMFAVAPAFMGLTTPLFEPALEVDMMRLVHGTQRMVFHRGLSAGDGVVAKSRIASIEDKGTGELLNIDVDLLDSDGQPAVEITSGLFIKAPGKKGRPPRGEAGGEKSADSSSPDATVVFQSEVRVADDQSQRYAEASGDHNPIHLDEDMAKMAGLPGIILHGLCTMAFVHNACVRQLDGDPDRLASVAVRFSRPVLMGERLHIEARGAPAGPWGISVRNPDGHLVLKDGRVEVRGK